MLAGTCLLALAHSVQAQVYPVRPVKIVVPFATKGAADIISRLLADRLSGVMQQPVVVQNLPGGGGSVATEAVARTAPDGYTLLYVSGATLVTTPIFARTPRYDPLTSFAPISLLSSFPSIVAVHPSLPARTLGELTDLIKAAPGRYRYATTGSGSHSYFAGELFKSQTQLDIKDVEAKIPLTAWRVLVNGDADIIFEVSVVLAASVKEGRARALAVMGHGRLSQFPDVPTTVELGLPELTAYVWSGLVAPAGTPPAIIQVLNEATRSILSEIETQATFVRYGMQAEGSTPEQFHRLIRAELTKWSRALPLSATEGK